MTNKLSGKQILWAIFSIAVWVISLLLEDRIKFYTECQLKQLKISGIYVFIVTVIWALVSGGLLVYWKIKSINKELTRTLYDYKMRLDFMNSIIIHNSANGRLNDISIDTVKKMKLTPQHFEYFGYDEAYIKLLFPDYKLNKN